MVPMLDITHVLQYNEENAIRSKIENVQKLNRSIANGMIADKLLFQLG